MGTSPLLELKKHVRKITFQKWGRTKRRYDARVGEAQRQELQGQDGQGVVLEEDLQMANLDQVERALRGRARGEGGLHVHVVCRRPENSARKPGQQNCRRKIDQRQS